MKIQHAYINLLTDRPEAIARKVQDVIDTLADAGITLRPNWARSAAAALRRGEDVAITSEEDYQAIAAAQEEMDSFGHRLAQESEGGWGE